jgi:hypothetical protein
MSRQEVWDQAGSYAARCEAPQALGAYVETK